jgi:ribosome modulation factor
MSEAKNTGRIDSPAFRRGVRAFKTGTSNPYNGPALRDEWQAGYDYAARKAEPPEGFRDGFAGRPMQMCAKGSKYAADYRAGQRSRERAAVAA